MSNKYTPKQFREILKNHRIQWDFEGRYISASDIDDIMGKLTKPEWMPANRQVYKNPDGKYYKQEEGYKCDPKSRPLTPLEVGPEPVKHLVEAIEESLQILQGHIKVYPEPPPELIGRLGTYAAKVSPYASKSSSQVNTILQSVLTKHKELMK